MIKAIIRMEIAMLAMKSILNRSSLLIWSESKFSKFYKTICFVSCFETSEQINNFYLNVILLFFPLFNISGWKLKHIRKHMIAINLIAQASDWA